jgi:hypothetical protein
VTYAAVNAGVGLPGGFVDEFNSRGTFLARIATKGSLYAPWGITLAPAGFGSFGGDLLIGQFGGGQILVYDPMHNDQFLGTLNGSNGMPIVNPFLWSLEFRKGGTNVDLNALYFTAGYNNQLDGLFGEIQATPEPATIALVLTGLSTLGARRLLGDRSDSRPEIHIPLRIRKVNIVTNVNRNQILHRMLYLCAPPSRVFLLYRGDDHIQAYSTKNRPVFGLG